MKRNEVRDLIKAAVQAVKSSYRFNSGRPSEFNSNRSNEYPYLWLESLSRGTELSENQMPSDDWNCIIHIAKLDKTDSVSEEYEAIVDECDLIAKKVTYQINQVVSGYKLLTLSGINSDPFIKKHADCTTGVILSFTLTSPDKTDVC
jgi:hypothetical protein